MRLLRRMVGIIRRRLRSEQRSAEKTPTPSGMKQCAICDRDVEHGLVVCPQCGAGVFRVTKTRPVRELTLSDIASASGQSTKSGGLTSAGQSNLVCRGCGAEYHSSLLGIVEQIGLDKVSLHTSADPEHALGECRLCGSGLGLR